MHICRHSRSDGKKPASSSTPLRQVGLTLWMEMHCVVQAKREKRSRRNGGTVGAAHGKLGCVPFHMCCLVLKGNLRRITRREVEQLQDGAGPGMLCVTPPEARRDPRELRGASPPGPSAPLASSVMVPLLGLDASAAIPDR